MSSHQTQAFILTHADDDVRQLALQAAGTADVDLPYALDQIAGRQKARTKLPTWAATEGIVYPPHLAMEQCSSERTARYKVEVAVRNLVNSNIRCFADLTGGFGVDFAFIAQAINSLSPSPTPRHLTFVERNPQLFAISSKNLQLLVDNAECVCADGVEFLRQSTEHYDLIYLDPARRDSNGHRTYGISDCTPDVLAIRDLLLTKADYVMVKLSPMLDWRKVVQDLGEQHIIDIHIVSVANECKELIVVLKGERLWLGASAEMECGQGDYAVHCVNLLPDGTAQSFSFHSVSGQVPVTRQGDGRDSWIPTATHHFLYEPNASIMKAGCFDEVGRRFGLQQIEKNSHLFISADFIDDFPGRVFQINAVSSMNKRELKENLKDMTQANITVRNFPMMVAELRRRLKLKDGGENYIFATTLSDKRHVLIICSQQVHRVGSNHQLLVGGDDHNLYT
jgi:hypothetical protein